MQKQEELVRLTGIVKRFGTFTANDRIDLSVKAGTVHAIVGENGAGKSTLMKILAGEEHPDEGEITIAGEPRTFSSPRDAQRAGIGIVHQHFLLADALRVWENVVLADEPGSALRLDSRAARRSVEELAATNGFPVDVNAVVRELGVGGRQRVEILKVLYRDARIIILDEPTAVLVPSEAQSLFAAMRAFTAAGAAVIFISHKLDEVLDFADEITVIRAGEVVGHRIASETSAAARSSQRRSASSSGISRDKASRVAPYVAIHAFHASSAAARSGSFVPRISAARKAMARAFARSPSLAARRSSTSQSSLYAPEPSSSRSSASIASPSARVPRSLR